MTEAPTMKRVLDVALASSVIVLGAPLFVAMLVAIKVDSPGPAFFSQIRIGRNRRPIRTLKLRTMIVDADRQGPQITASRDPRITRVGRWLRRSKLDELPQLWNVVRGDMSLVGPRPEVPRYVSMYRPEWEKLFTVRPGLTDLASLAFRDEETLLSRAYDHERAYREVIMPMKLELALDGVERSSVSYDLRVIVQTLFALVRRHPPHADAVFAEALRRIEQLGEDS